MSDESFDERGALASTSIAAHSEPVQMHRSRRALAALAVAGFVVGSGSVALAWSLSGSGPADDGAFTLVGQVRLGHNDGATGSCGGSSSFSDVDKGALVTVYDSADRVVATGALGDGEYDKSACVFPVVLPGVPGGSGSYSVQVRWHGKTKMTNEQARTGSLVIDLG